MKVYNCMDCVEYKDIEKVFQIIYNEIRELEACLSQISREQDTSFHDYVSGKVHELYTLQRKLKSIPSFARLAQTI